MNVGTIVEADMIKVRLVRSRGAEAMVRRGGRLLGEVEEYFIESWRRATPSSSPARS